MPPTSRVFFAVKLCVGFLLPCAIYTMGVQVYLLSTHQLDSMIRPNSILLLTTSILTILFLLCWTLARSNGPVRPPPSGKKITFVFCLGSTIFWLASFWTGVDVAAHAMTCREAAPGVQLIPWSDGMPCRLHRVGVAFTAVGLLSSLVVLVAMVEISDRPFGGVSTETTISWTAEKFREALLDLTAQEGGAGFTKELLADRSRGVAASAGDSGSVQSAVEEGEVVQDRI
ncbi:hypothetical protein Q9L58_004904 [Maublancomyces gigas]|uniref:MARVEL domain-containing protein n=1 Tax=Discina gigas TaxID=1032678 RepID=A0ABR3GK03_9PEZI